MILFFYAVSAIWTIVGLLIVMGAWNENESDYEQIKGKISQPLALSYEEKDFHFEQRVTMAKIYLEDDPKEYRLRGNLYHLNRAGMESIQVGETLHLLVKKTTIVGGFEITNHSKSAPISGIYRPNGERIISLDKGIAHAKKRLWIGIGFITAGILLGIWMYSK